MRLYIGGELVGPIRMRGIGKKLIDLAQRPKTCQRASKPEQKNRKYRYELRHSNPRAFNWRFLRSRLTSQLTPINNSKADMAQIASAVATVTRRKISASETGPKITSNTPASRSAAA